MVGYHQIATLFDRLVKDGLCAIQAKQNTGYRLPGIAHQQAAVVVPLLKPWGSKFLQRGNNFFQKHGCKLHNARRQVQIVYELRINKT